MASFNIMFTLTRRKMLKFRHITNEQQVLSLSRMVEVGHFEPPNNETTSYEPGTLFLHKIFAYRGIILFPWLAKVQDNSISESSNALEPPKRKKSHNKESYYYQVLVDSRDRPFLKSYMQNEAVTFIRSNNHEKGLETVRGMDYVSHEDVLPYTSQAKNSIDHKLLDYYFYYDPGEKSCRLVKPALKYWQKTETSFLDLSKVSVGITEDVRVTAIPFYLGYQQTEFGKKYWWRYQIRLENLGKHEMQLRNHNWRILEKFGSLETVQGLGASGREPFLSKRFPAFQYYSHKSLISSSGLMWGTYLMEKDNGKSFECHIPLFELKSKDIHDGPA